MLSLSGFGSSLEYSRPRCGWQLPSYSFIGGILQLSGLLILFLKLALDRILGWSSLAAVVVVLVVYIFNYPLAIYNVSVSWNPPPPALHSDPTALLRSDHSCLMESQRQENEYCK